MKCNETTDSSELECGPRVISFHLKGDGPRREAAHLKKRYTPAGRRSGALAVCRASALDWPAKRGAVSAPRERPREGSAINGGASNAGGRFFCGDGRGPTHRGLVASRPGPRRQLSADERQFVFVAAPSGLKPKVIESL